MADINLKEYLKNVAELEGSVYNQERAFESCRQTFANNCPHKIPVSPIKEIPMPAGKPLEKDSDQWKEHYRTDRAKEGEKVVEDTGIVAYGLCVIFAIIAIIGMLILLISGGESYFGIGMMAVGCPMYFLFAIVSNSQKKRAQNNFIDEFDEARYQQDLAEYQEKVDATEKAREEEKARFEAEDKKADLALAERKQLHAKNQDETLALLSEKLEETKKILEKYYAKDIIFGKYRNLVAMTTMYEYFASGRCTELEGPNGAYNLYEQETRQNVIITNLQEVNANLGDIKNNQYVLYQAVNAGLQSLAKVQNDISDMARCVKNIETSSAVSAYCAEVTAMNGIYQNSIMTF